MAAEIVIKSYNNHQENVRRQSIGGYMDKPVY